MRIYWTASFDQKFFFGALTLTFLLFSMGEEILLTVGYSFWVLLFRGDGLFSLFCYSDLVSVKFFYSLIDSLSGAVNGYCFDLLCLVENYVTMTIGFTISLSVREQLKFSSESLTGWHIYSAAVLLLVNYKISLVYF